MITKFYYFPLAISFLSSITFNSANELQLDDHMIPKQKPLFFLDRILTPEEEKLERLIDEIWHIKQIRMFGIQKSSSFQNLLEKKKQDIKEFFQNNHHTIYTEHFNYMKNSLGAEFTNGLNLTIIEEEN